MDKQAKKLQNAKDDGVASEAGSEVGSNEESEHEEKVRKSHRKKKKFLFEH